MKGLLHQSQVLFKRHGSTILTCIGGVGVIATAVTAVKATPEAIELIDRAKDKKGEALTKTETIKAAWKPYIPSALIGAGTLACVFGANVLNKRQQAALMSAYALLDNSYKEYRKKVEELHGEGSDREIMNEIAKDHYEDEDDYGDGLELFYDEYSQRYFRSTELFVLQAEYELNRILSESCGAFLNEFYELMDLEPVDYGNHVGWSTCELVESYCACWVDFRHTKVEMEDGMECTIISFMQEPIFDFENY